VNTVTAAGILGASYLLGSLPFSYWVGRGRGVDVREAGSGNVGATNVLRTAGKIAGITAFVLDALKGTAAGLLGAWIDPRLAGPAAFAAVLGHVCPVWLRFRGGKGVATGFGAMAALAPLAAAWALAAFVVVAGLSRMVSLGSVVGALVLAGVAPLLGASAVTSVSIASIALLIVARHHANIVRIWLGTERRIGGGGGAA
jgi:acyl phosphate:glycerol-3-phosphate acyltransferase